MTDNKLFDLKVYL